MERGLILLLAALVVCVSQGVQGTAHLSFSNNTQVNISREGCGDTKLCRETPTGCDPTGQSSCLFMSANASAPMAPNGFELSVELRGDSSGYIALGLTANPSVGTTKLFICAANNANNGSFFFRTMTKNNTNDMLTPNEMRVKEIRGMVNGSVIMCEFIIESLNATATTTTTTRTSHVTTFNATLGTGMTNGTGIGAFNVSLNIGSVNLRDNSNPTTAVPTTMMPTNATMTNTTTMANTTMANSGASVQPHAVLLLLSVLVLSVMLREGRCC